VTPHTFSIIYSYGSTMSSLFKHCLIAEIWIFSSITKTVRHSNNYRARGVKRKKTEGTERFWVIHMIYISWIRFESKEYNICTVYLLSLCKKTFACILYYGCSLTWLYWNKALYWWHKLYNYVKTWQRGKCQIIFQLVTLCLHIDMLVSINL
jgi:hypothetical protein